MNSNINEEKNETRKCVEETAYTSERENDT